MIIAKEKRQSNIVEYVLYMWQVEDLIRAYQLDIEAIKKNVIPQYNLSGDILTETTEWYDNLIEMMKLEQITKKGHLQVITNIINDIHIKTFKNSIVPSCCSSHISYWVYCPTYKYEPT